MLVLALRGRGLLRRCDVPLMVEAVEDTKAEGRVPEDLIKTGAMVSVRFRDGVYFIGSEKGSRWRNWSRVWKIASA